MGFLLDKCKLKKMDDEILSTCHPFTCGDEDLDDRKLSHDIPREKRMRRYPAVLIGRLGINVDFCHQGIGSELLDFIKSWFIDEENKTGCRFLIVDAYNCMVPLDFYQKNEFLFLFSTEQQEAENLGYDMTKSMHTRLMYYDLKKLTSN